MRLRSALLAGLFLIAGPMCSSQSGEALCAQDEQSTSATQGSHALGTPGQTFRDCPDCPEMVVVPEGSFLMGKRFGLGDWKMPVRQANVSRSFALAKSVVTQGQWRAVMGVNPRKFNNCGDDCPCGDRCPVGSASWDDAQEFIRLLNKKTGKRYRLPSEVKWEYAFDSRNMRGLFDTSHPVFEWVENSLDDDHSVVQANGSSKKKIDGERMIRGGLWFNSPDLLSSAIHEGPESALRQNRLGLRLARMLP